MKSKGSEMGNCIHDMFVIEACDVIDKFDYK